ncbi:MAG: VWA domain-containing protein [Acidobacteria bacterium]|nr:VWA domain-containing protein [Acidobacteriota bacterium]
MVAQAPRKPNPLVLLLALPLLQGGEVWAQEQPAYTVRVEVALVNLDVAVGDRRGRFVAGLTQSNFRVFEDEQEQTITHFASSEAPLTVALLVETSPAVYLIRDDHLQAAFTLLDYLKPADNVALARYDQHWQRVADFTRDKALFRNHLRQLGYSLGMAELNLFDALAETLDWLAAPEAVVPGRKAVLLISTGLDTHSRMREQALAGKLAASDVTLFAIATGSLLRAPAENESRRRRRRTKDEAESLNEFDAAFAAADARLKGLAEETGGRAYFPANGEELRAAYREIGERLRHTYSLGYVPTNRTRDGRFRALRVALVDDEGRALPYRVITRGGYVAPRE